jgi:hypothetical protein
MMAWVGSFRLVLRLYLMLEDVRRFVFVSALIAMLLAVCECTLETGFCNLCSVLGWRALDGSYESSGDKQSVSFGDDDGVRGEEDVDDRNSVSKLKVLWWGLQSPPKCWTESTEDVGECMMSIFLLNVCEEHQ